MITTPARETLTPNVKNEPDPTEGRPLLLELTVIIPTHRRVEVLSHTLKQILRCAPRPAEILVHIDAGDLETEPVMRSRFPEVGILTSPRRQGPGGGRNRLVAAANHDLIASFDDDSWPVALTFFREAWDLFQTHPDYALIACRIEERGREPAPRERLSATPIRSTGAFVGCGCLFRKSAFLATSGYLPIPLAYGVEETDVALQMLAGGGTMGKSDALVVRHDCDRDTHHASSAINAAQIRNTALLAFLRFPLSCWPLAAGQVVNRVLYSVRKRRLRGIITGLLSIPRTCWEYRRFRRPVSLATFRRWSSLRKTT